MSLLPKKRRCWYCRRIGRFGFVSGRASVLAPQCAKDKACFARARYRSLVETLRTLAACPDCMNLAGEGPGIVPSYTAAGWNGRGPDGDPCDSDFHPENGYVLR
jgi:hypothetical protein